MQSIALMYHDIIGLDTAISGFQNKTAHKYKVSAVEFENQVSRIRRYLDEHNIPDSQVIFTFDDGGTSFLSEAAPILEKFRFKGIFFIATGYIGTPGFLDADQIRELVRRGHAVGPHSHSHPERMSALNDDDINDEWSVSQMILNEVLGYRATVASIPNGYSSAAVEKAMASSGINEIYTSEASAKTRKKNAYSIKGRYAITADMTADDVIAIITSPLTRFKISFRNRVLSIAKWLLGDYYLAIRKKVIK